MNPNAKVLNKQSPLAEHFRQEIVPFLEKPTYQPLQSKRLIGPNNLFDASLITSCACEILPLHFQPVNESPLFDSWENTNLKVSQRWMDAILDVGEPELVQDGYLAVDNELHLQTYIHLLARWDSKLFAINFCYLPTDEFLEVKSTCARKRDVYQISAGIFLLNADAGLIIYEDGIDYELFGVARSQRLFAAIEKKCRWMRDYLLLKKLPRCPHQRQPK